MRILLTGHTGFIGSNMLEFLKDQSGVEPIGYSKSTGQDIFDLMQLKKVVKDCDMVYHFAAYAKPAESVLNPLKAIMINIEGTLNVLEACREYSVPLVYPSSCEVYGDSKAPINEEFPMNPPNPYAASKAAADRICHAYFRSYDLDVKNVRLFNPYGTNQQLNKIIPTFYFQAVKNEPITVYGDGTATRDYVCVDDITRGLWLSRDLAPGTTINLATGKASSSLDIANRIIELTGSRSEIRLVDYPKLFGKILNQVGSYQKAESLMEWTPSIPLDDGVKRTITWLKEIPDERK